MISPEVQERYALSPVQEGMYFHHLFAPGSGVDIEQMVIDMPEAIDAALLERAWNAIIARHAILRSSFESTAAGTPEQVVWRNIPVSIAHEDLSASSADEQHRWTDEYLKRDRQAGFDVSKPPLLRLTLAKLGASKYRLFWTFHHILLDGRSFATVLREVSDAYDNFTTGREPSTAAPVPYRSYIEWVQSLDQAGAKEFWRQRLKGFGAPTPLIQDRTPETGGAQAYGEEDLFLSPDLTNGLSALADREGVTLNTMLMGAWGVLLSRYSGEPDVVFGATKTARRGTVEGAEAIVGLLLNTIPIRVNADGDITVPDYLKKIRQDWLSLRNFEHTPLVHIAAASDVPSGTALFDTLVVFESRRFEDELRSLGGKWADRRIDLREQTNYALTLAGYGGERLRLKIEYDSRRFGRDTVQRMLGHLEAVLEQMSAQPSRKLSDVDLLTEAERRQLSYDWSGGTASYPNSACIHELVEAQAAKTPDRIALSSGTERITYADLNQRANRFANHLRTLGVGPETLVGMFMERSVDMIVALLGILKAGGAYVPLDPVYPKDRLALILDDANVPVLVIQESLRAQVPQIRGSAVAIDTDWPTIANQSAENPPAAAKPENLAYVIYTSGSTGRPKGVLVTHYNVVRLFQATDHWYHFNQKDVWTLFHSYAFDFSVWEIWGALMYGGRLVVVPYMTSRSPQAFHELLRTEGVTVLNQTPSAFRQLIEADTVLNTPPDAMKLRYVIFGGEALDLQSLAPWYARYRDDQPVLINMYGITETTVHVTYRALTEKDVKSGTGSVIGGPIPDLQLYILDEHRRPAPIGVAGEMYVGGAGVARGYLNRPELTAERFVSNHLREGDTGKLYRSGDLARYLANGDVEYLGRIDHQVKIRGFRIELGEIETVIAAFNAVRHVLVLAVQDCTADKRLVAYVVPEKQIDLSELRAHIRQKLPDYMVPSAFVMLEAFPLTENGKIDRRALPQPVQDAEAFERSYVAPRNGTEQRIAEIWADVLRLPKAGIHDNFFDLGGHSLLATQVISRIHKAFEVDVPLRALFDAPTIAGLSTAVTAAMTDRDAELEALLAEIEAMPEDAASKMKAAQQ